MRCSSHTLLALLEGRSNEIGFDGHVGGDWCLATRSIRQQIRKWVVVLFVLARTDELIAYIIWPSARLTIGEICVEWGRKEEPPGLLYGNSCTGSDDRRRILPKA